MNISLGHHVMYLECWLPLSLMQRCPVSPSVLIPSGPWARPHLWLQHWHADHSFLLSRHRFLNSHLVFLFALGLPSSFLHLLYWLLLLWSNLPCHLNFHLCFLPFLQLANLSEWFPITSWWECQHFLHNLCLQLDLLIWVWGNTSNWLLKSSSWEICSAPSLIQTS